jgi:aryl-alcohol dehydrogenase-like predicted oxidoreductase
MHYSRLGSSNLSVSRVCLGTMTWGNQNTQTDADEQIAFALDAGINFVDTAEMYSVPPSEKTYGLTERYIGNWLSRNKEKRCNIILASKIAGTGFSYIRNNSKISGETIEIALHDSLERLQTDYLDVYQLHWPNRSTAHFGTHWPNEVLPTKLNPEKEKDNMRDILRGVDAALKSGKIRHWALSDETTWGIHTFLKLCDEMNIAKPVSIQNEFSLVHTKDWPYLIESCVLEDIAYLPWSPLASGMLSGKYLNGARPEGSRWTLVQRNGLFRDNPYSQQATQEYCNIAVKYNMSPSTLALGWVNQVDGVTSTIIGATTIAQLSENIEAFALALPTECLTDIENVLKKYSMPF